MKKSLLYLSLFCGMFGFSACSDDESPYMPEEFLDDPTGGNTAVTTIGWSESEKVVSFLNETSDVSVGLEIVRTGTSNPNAVTANFGTLSKEELDQWNTANGTSYSLLPNEYYSLPGATEVGADVKELEVGGMTIKQNVAEIDDLGETDYVVPVRLASEQCAVSEDYAVLMVLVKPILPTFYIKENEEAAEPVVITTGDATGKTFNFDVALNVDNRWKETAATIAFENDETVLQGYVDTYNRENGQRTQLLPAGMYSFNGGSDLSLNAGESEGTFTVNVTGKSETPLPEGEYTLPVVLKSVEQTPFHVDRQRAAYLRITVVTPRLELSLPVDNVDAIAGSGNTTDVTLTASLNVGYLWDDNGQITLVTDETELNGLIASYNEQSGDATEYTLLGASMYELKDNSFAKGDDEKDITISIKGEELTAGKSYLLPVKLASGLFGGNVMYDDQVLYLKVEAWNKLVYSDGILSSNSEEVSNWATLPVSMLMDNAYKGNGDHNNGVWSSRWNGDNPHGDKDATYGVYVDVNVSSLNLASTVRLVLQVTTAWDSQYRPGTFQIYTSADEGETKTWTASGNTMTMDTQTVYTISGRTRNGLNSYTDSDNIRINSTEVVRAVDSSVKFIRIAFLTNSRGDDLRTSGNVHLDELIVYGY